MSDSHINLKVTHRLLWRLYGYRSVISLLSGLGILLAPAWFASSQGYNVITELVPLVIIGILWVISGILMAGALIKWPYKLAKVGMAMSAILYFLWGTGILTNQLINLEQPTSLFAVLAYYSLGLTSVYVLMEPPINPETAIKTKEK